MARLKRPRVGLSADALHTLESIRVDGQMPRGRSRGKGRQVSAESGGFC